MKIRPALAFVAFVLLASTAQAGRGCGPGWGWGGPGFYGGGWGGGYCGPGIGFAIAAPVVVVRPRPVYVYDYAEPVHAPRRVVYVERAPGQATLVRAQAQLARLGYYRGTVDGSFGPLTSRAISLFQADNGLRVTGRLDSATLATL